MAITIFGWYFLKTGHGIGILEQNTMGAETMKQETDFYSMTKDEIRQLNREITKMRYEMHKMQDEGKYYFMDLNIDSLPVDELKQEYETMRMCLEER